MINILTAQQILFDTNCIVLNKFEISRSTYDWIESFLMVPYLKMTVGNVIIIQFETRIILMHLQDLCQCYLNFFCVCLPGTYLNHNLF